MCKYLNEDNLDSMNFTIVLKLFSVFNDLKFSSVSGLFNAVCAENLKAFPVPFGLQEQQIAKR